MWTIRTPTHKLSIRLDRFSPFREGKRETIGKTVSIRCGAAAVIG